MHSTVKVTNKVRSEKRIDGYILESFIPAAALTGFDMFEHPRLGFTYTPGRNGRTVVRGTVRSFKTVGSDPGS